jgi:hypothetical protein
VVLGVRGGRWKDYPDYIGISAMWVVAADNAGRDSLGSTRPILRSKGRGEEPSANVCHGSAVPTPTVVLMDDLNKNVYLGPIVSNLRSDNLRMPEVCGKTTGVALPPTHLRGSVPIDGVFTTSGLDCLAVTLLPSRTGVGDHLVFLLNFRSSSILGDVLPKVIPASRRLLNWASDKIRFGYNRVLNQLVNRHLIFHKLLRIEQDSACVSLAQIQLCMDRVDLELEQFMRSSEIECHKYKRNNIEWSPEVGVWIHRRWLLVRVRTFLEVKTRDPRNLFQKCSRRGVKDPRQLTFDKLKAEFLVCLHNIKFLEQNSPNLRRKFLTTLVSNATLQGDTVGASRVTGIIHREASQKR